MKVVALEMLAGAVGILGEPKFVGCEGGPGTVNSCCLPQYPMRQSQHND